MHFIFLAGMLVDKGKDRITPGEKVSLSGGNGNSPLFCPKVASILLVLC